MRRRRPRPWRPLLLALGLRREAVVEAGDTTCVVGQAGAEACAAADPASAGRAHFSAHRGVDLNRTGFSPHSPPRNLSRPAWTFDHLDHEPFHQTPVIDGDYNVYMGSGAGYIFSLDRNGKLRWKVKAGRSSAQCPSLHGDKVYVACRDGVVLALEAATGKELWRNRIAEDLPPDTYAVTATEDTVISPANTAYGMPFGAAEVVAMDAATGVIRWRYFFLMLHNSLLVNFLPIVYNGTVVFSDSNGGVHCLSLDFGKHLWSFPGEDSSSFALGGVGLGPNAVLYLGAATSVSREGKGLVRALDLQGKLLWQRRLAMEIHAAPAIAALRPGGPLALVIGAGRPTGNVQTFRERLRVKMGLDPEPLFEGRVHAMDAETGETLWTFQPEPWREQACAGATADLECLPDLWSLPVIAPDGTVYINWSAGGVTYALRDANGDGTVDEGDPAEVSKFSSGTGSTGPPVIAPGMLTVAACRHMYTFLE